MFNESSSGTHNTFSKATFGKDKNLDTHVTSSLASNGNYVNQRDLIRTKNTTLENE
jgi:hypothetical protein